MSSRDDPLALSGLETKVIEEKLAAKNAKGKHPSELDLMKEQRLKAKEDRLNTFPSKPPTAPEKPSAKPVEDPQKLLDKIGAYRERFPNLKTRNPKLSAKSSVDEMQDELHFLEMQLGTSKDTSLGNMLFIGTMVGIETITQRYNPLNLHLEGLGKVAKDNIEQFTPLVDELMIKHSANIYVSPEARLMLSVASLVMTVHSANSGDPRLAEAIKRVSQPATKPAGSENL
jgi:hypothetical protein